MGFVMYMGKKQRLLRRRVEDDNQVHLQVKLKRNVICIMMTLAMMLFGLKKIILFELPYWKDNKLRHNLDIIHMEKNVCDNILGTILNVDKKSRDDANVRKALEEVGIKPHLWLQPSPGRDPIMPVAPYSLSLHEERQILESPTKA